MRMFAQPYDLDAVGFYFDDFEEYETKAKANRNRYGAPVEEYEIQVIDGDDAEVALAEAFGVNQGNLEAALEFIAEINDAGDDMLTAAVLYRHQDRSATLEDVSGEPHDDLREVVVFVTGDASDEEGAILEYAEDYVEDAGLLDGALDVVAQYFNYEAFARDLRLGGDVSGFEFNGVWYVMDNHA